MATSLHPEPANTDTDTDTDTGAASPWRLEELIANRQWVRRRLPFPHIVAGNVFVPDFYAGMEQEFHRIEHEHPEAFQRNMTGYDASGTDLGRYRDGPLSVFVSREWHDLIAAVTGVEATGDVSASMHHHDPGSASGWPHNDLNPGWFPDPPPGPDEVRLTTDSGVGYHHGERNDGVRAQERVRAVSVLFYLANPPWRPEHGGETALYPSLAAAEPTHVVPPVNNSLVLFECTPFSWHGYLRNGDTPRNSIVMWLHRDKQIVRDRWGEQTIVGW